MEEERQKGMSRPEAQKYLRFLIKEWSSAENEVCLSFRLLIHRRAASTPF